MPYFKAAAAAFLGLFLLGLPSTVHAGLSASDMSRLHALIGRWEVTEAFGSSGLAKAVTLTVTEIEGGIRLVWTHGEGAGSYRTQALFRHDPETRRLQLVEADDWGMVEIYSGRFEHGKGLVFKGRHGTSPVQRSFRWTGLTLTANEYLVGKGALENRFLVKMERAP